MLNGTPKVSEEPRRTHDGHLAYGKDRGPWSAGIGLGGDLVHVIHPVRVRVSIYRGIDDPTSTFFVWSQSKNGGFKRHLVPKEAPG